MKYLQAALFFFIVYQNLAAQDTIHFAKPVFLTEGQNRMPVNAMYIYRVQAMDSAGYPLSFSATKLPVWLSYDTASHTISGKALKVGQYPIQVEVSNQHTVCRQNFMLTVYNNRTVNILCLGNSITNGTNKYNSYRRVLWQLLHGAGYNFDLIGSWNKHHMGGDVPDPDFDTDHEGHSGWTFEHFFHPPSWDSARGMVDDWLKIYKPDMVLLELGTNDVFQCRPVKEMLKDLDQLIAVLRERNSGVKIFLAQIPPLGKQWATKKLCGDDIDYDHAIQNLNKAFAGFSKSRSEKRSPVILVDQYSGIDTDTEMYDDIHPNEKGEQKMAEKWFKAIRPYLHKLKELSL